MSDQFEPPTDLFRVSPDGVLLQASTSSTSGYLTFPPESGQKVVDLSPEGVLYTWTSQEFPPPSPPAIAHGDFVPYGVGYVEFPEGLLVEGRLTTCDPESLRIGGKMRVVTVPFAGSTTFAFEPAEQRDEGVA